MARAGGNTKAQAAPEYRPPIIRSLGTDDWADGTGFVKLMLLGATDLGKTRWSSAWPRPVYLQCEPLVSIVRRRIQYEDGLAAPRAMRITSSADMLNAARYLKDQGTKRVAGKAPLYQTVVVDTLDAFSRIVKNEWMEQNNQGVFTGHDAWGYLEAKMTTLLTRLMVLPANVIILCHWKDREVSDPNGGAEKVTIYEPALQGQVKDSIFQDFSLVGWMDYYWVGSGDDRERRRGITFDATPQRPFLKNHYNLTPPGVSGLGTKWWPVEINDGTSGEGDPETFEATNFGAIYSAIVQALDEIPESTDILQIPDGDVPDDAKAQGKTEGGPVAGAVEAVKTATKTAAAKTAAAKTAATKPQDKPEAETAPAQADGAGAAAVGPATPSSSAAESDASSAPVESVATDVSSETSAPVAEAAETPAAATESTHDEAVAAAQEALGAEVVTETTPVDNNSEGTTAETTAETPAVYEEGTCPLCGKSLEGESPDIVQLSRLKHRTLTLPNGVKVWDTGGVCYEDYQRLNEQKQNKTGLYDPEQNPQMAS